MSLEEKVVNIAQNALIVIERETSMESLRGGGIVTEPYGPWVATVTYLHPKNSRSTSVEMTFSHASFGGLVEDMWVEYEKLY